MAVRASGTAACACPPKPSGNSPRAADSSSSCYPWGDELPEPSTRAAGATAPNRSALGEPNGYGLFDMCQNVHEWCSDWYDPRYYARLAGRRIREGRPHGTRRASRGGAWRHHIKIVALRRAQQHPARIPLRRLRLPHRGVSPGVRQPGNLAQLDTLRHAL